MSENYNKTWVFFYGTFMSAEVLRQQEVDCETTIPAKLDGYELVINPRVNLRKQNKSSVYGGLAYISQRDISRLYRSLKTEFGITYYPFPVKVETREENSKQAICYISFDMIDAKANPTYINKLTDCAKELNAPEDYIRRIKSLA